MNDAIDKLTKPWNDVLSPRETGRNGYTPIDYPPMLDMLREAIGSSVGTTGRSASSGGATSVLNLQALALWEHIDGTVRAWWQEVSKRKPPRDLKEALIGLDGMLTAAKASNQIRTDLHAHIIAMFPRWVSKIWEIYDPYNPVELAGSCPNPECEQTRWTDADGSESTALVGYYRKGAQPYAKCRCCTWEWSTSAELVILGRHLGATMDTEFLQPLGLV